MWQPIYTILSHHMQWIWWFWIDLTNQVSNKVYVCPVNNLNMYQLLVVKLKCRFTFRKISEIFPQIRPMKFHILWIVYCTLAVLLWMLHVLLLKMLLLKMPPIKDCWLGVSPQKPLASHPPPSCHLQDRLNITVMEPLAAAPGCLNYLQYAVLTPAVLSNVY